MSKHTPGPWKEDITKDGEVFINMGEGHSVFIGDLENTCSECHANAHLIAAAPEMLEVLHRVEWWLSTYPDTKDILELVREVIIKASGEQS